MQQAVAWALEQQRSIVAARLEVDSVAVESTIARLWPNPELAYSVNNLVLGRGNDQERGLTPTFAEQTIQSIGIEQTFDIWRRRWARLGSAKASAEVARFQLEDALREVVFQTRRAYLNAAREQREHALAKTHAAHWQGSAQLMARRLSAGDTARADVAKIELEALRAQNGEIAAAAELAMARAELAAQIGLPHSALMPDDLQFPARSDAQRATAAVTDLEALAMRAQKLRPDVRAAQQTVQWAKANIVQQRREALPDITVGINYGRSQFMISGDNPHTLGFSVAVPLPVADRNQAGRSLANIALQRADNELHRAHIAVHKEVEQAASLLMRALQGLQIFEAQGMLQRAQDARDMAHKAVKSGAFSLLDVLEAERTAIEVQAEYLVMQDALFQAQAELAYVTTEELL